MSPDLITALLAILEPVAVLVLVWVIAHVYYRKLRDHITDAVGVTNTGVINLRNAVDEQTAKRAAEIRVNLATIEQALSERLDSQDQLLVTAVAQTRPIPQPAKPAAAKKAPAKPSEVTEIGSTTTRARPSRSRAATRSK